jgi:hypothetical protein
MIISITVLPVSISFLAERSPLILFRSSIGCAAWWYLWQIVVRMSIFLVICVCISRTIALKFPFFTQKIRYLIPAVATFLLLQVANLIGFYLHDHVKIVFVEKFARPEMTLMKWKVLKRIFFRFLLISRNMIYVVPAFVVLVSCIASAVLLNRSKHIVQQRELQRSRTRATITIFLFALVYGVCNLPMVYDYIAQTDAMYRNDYSSYKKQLAFDTHSFYNNTTNLLMIAANSAANPALYFWRMPRLRRHILSRVHRVRRVSKKLRRYSRSIPRPQGFPHYSLHVVQEGRRIRSASSHQSGLTEPLTGLTEF